MAISKIKIGEVEHEFQTTIDNVIGLRDALNSKPNTDTKNTAGSTNSSKKLFLIGSESQGANPQTYSHDTAYVGTDGHLYSNSSQVVNLASTQTISGAKTFTNALKILNGSAAGAFVLGANVNSTGLTANTRKLGRMGVPAFTSDGSTVNSTVAGISFDAQQYANYADFGGHPNNASSIAPDVIRFVVANAHNNSVSGSRTLALQISKQNGLTDTAGAPASVLGAKFFVPLIATESITASGGVVGNVTGDLTGTSTKAIGDEDGNPIKTTYATKTVASTSANGLLSSTDKSRIDSMWNVWSADGTNDPLVNKVQEVLSAFDRYPEGSTIVDVLASKVNTTTTVNGHALSGDVTVTKSDVELGNVDNVKQYSASNPPPYPVTSVNEKTGAVTLAKGDIGLGNVDNVKQYSASNPPPYPVSSVAGKTGAVTLAKSDVGLGNVENKSSATIRSEITSSNVTTALGYTPVSKAGGTMNDGASLKFSTYGTRFVTITGNSITADMSNETGGWAGNFAAVKHKDPNSTATDGTSTTTMLGWYGGATALNYIYMGGSYSDPYMKMTPTGQFTFKNTPKVGTTNVALATDINNGTLTIQKNGTNVATFTANQSGTSTANITVPTTLEDISDTTSYVRMTSSERTKLSGIAANANNFSLPYRLASVQASGTGALSDPNNGLETGFYYVNGSTNRPPFSQSTNMDYRILVTAYGSTWLQQIATDFRCDDIFYRRKESGTWKPWVKIYPIDDATTSVRGLMSSSDKTKLDGIATGANKTTVDSALSSTSTNPVQNKIVHTALSTKLDANGWLTNQSAATLISPVKDNQTVLISPQGITVTNEATPANGCYVTFPQGKRNTALATLDDIPTIDTALSSTSTNPVQNKVVNTALGTKLDANGWATYSNGQIRYTDGSDYIVSYQKDGIYFARDVYGTESKLYFPEGKTGTIATTDDISSSNGTDTNTTYDLSASKNSTNGNAKINLTAGGSGSGTDSVTIKGTGGTTVTTDANGVVTINSPTSSSSGSTVSSEMPIISYTGCHTSDGLEVWHTQNYLILNVKVIGGGAFHLGDRLELCAVRKSNRSIREASAGAVRYRLRALFKQDITQEIIDSEDSNIKFIISYDSKYRGQLFHNDTITQGVSNVFLRVRRAMYTENGKEYNAKFSNIITLTKTYAQNPDGDYIKFK